MSLHPIIPEGHLLGKFHTKIISTGSLRLDIALGTGGYPAGTIIEVSGPPNSGKSTLANHAVAEAQKLGGVCAWLDIDQNFSRDYAQRCGVQVEDLYYSDTNCAEKALDILETLVKSDAFSLIVLDSIPALVPAAEILGEQATAPQETNSQLLSTCLSRISTKILNNGAVVLFTNIFDFQLSRVYHNLADQSHRMAIKLRAAIHIRLLPDWTTDTLGTSKTIHVRITKNRFQPCLYSTNFDIMYIQGINKSTEVFDLGVFLKEIAQHSEGFSFGSKFLGKTSAEVIEYLRQDVLIRSEIETKIRRRLIPQH